MFRMPFISSALVLALFACGRSSPVDDKAANAATKLPSVNAPAPSTIGEPHVATTPARPLPAPTATIPAGLQGRWGLTPADCVPGRSDAKGLLIISPGELRFYESRAVPAADVQADGDAFDIMPENGSEIRYYCADVDSTTTRVGGFSNSRKCGVVADDIAAKRVALP